MLDNPTELAPFFSASLADADPDIARAISAEYQRQHDEIELIASENIVSQAVIEAQGSVLTNKYAEGYPGRRYYGGCQYVDIPETLAIERACKLFDCSFANVQPHSQSCNQTACTRAQSPRSRGYRHIGSRHSSVDRDSPPHIYS